MDGIYIDSWAVSDNVAIAELSIWAIIIGIIVLSVAMIVVRGIKLYQIANAKEIKVPALAFVPFAQSFTMGAISDKLKKEHTGNGGINFVLMPIFYVLKWVGFGAFAYGIFSVINAFVDATVEFNDWIPSVDLLEYLGGSVLPLVIGIAAFIVASIVYKVFFEISLYRIYRAYKSKSCEALSGLSVIGGSFFSLAFLFSIKGEEA